MTQLVIRNSGEQESLRLIELQGTLESECDDLSGMEIGELSFNAKVR
jgi:hypothetical protein